MAAVKALVERKFVYLLYIRWSNYIFFGLSGISAVFPVIRVFPVNIRTQKFSEKNNNK